MWVNTQAFHAENQECDIYLYIYKMQLVMPSVMRHLSQSSFPGSSTKTDFLITKVRSDSKLHAKTSRICVRHSLVVFVEFRTLHNIRESRAEELHAKTGSIVCISKCCWV